MDMIGGFVRAALLSDGVDRAAIEAFVLHGLLARVLSDGLAAAAAQHTIEPEQKFVVASSLVLAMLVQDLDWMVGIDERRPIVTYARLVVPSGTSVFADAAKVIVYPNSSNSSAVSHAGQQQWWTYLSPAVAALAAASSTSSSSSTSTSTDDDDVGPSLVQRVISSLVHDNYVCLPDRKSVV